MMNRVVSPYVTTAMSVDCYDSYAFNYRLEN